MAKIIGKRAARKADKLANEAKELQKLLKADQKKYQAIEEIRLRKIGAKMRELAPTHDDVRRVLEFVVEQIRKDRGGKIFEDWVVPGPPDPDVKPSGRRSRRKTAPTNVSGNQETEPMVQLEAHPGDVEKTAVTEPVAGEKRDADELVSWKAKFETRPVQAILTNIKRLGGRWNKDSEWWNGKVSDTLLSELRHIVESAGGEFSTLPDGPAAHAR